MRSLRTVQVRLLLLCVLSVVVVTVLFAVLYKELFFNERVLEVHFLDIGQGDATFIEAPDGTQILIDGGPNAGVLGELGVAMGFFDREIDLLVATHPDLDHIGGLVDVLLRYEVNMILVTENESDTPASKAFNELVQSEGATVLRARSGQVFNLGSGDKGDVTLRILFPDRDVSGLESNTSSIVAQLVYGDTEFLLTGDSPLAIEEYLVSLYGNVLKSDVLKLGHHGSRTSTGEVFLKTVDPDLAIVSSGKDNRYGHPHKEVMDLLTQFGIATKNTADVGSILLESNGVEVESR